MNSNTTSIVSTIDINETKNLFINTYIILIILLPSFLYLVYFFGYCIYIKIKYKSRRINPYNFINKNSSNNIEIIIDIPNKNCKKI